MRQLQTRTTGHINATLTFWKQSDLLHLREKGGRIKEFDFKKIKKQLPKVGINYKTVSSDLFYNGKLKEIKLLK